MGITDKKLNMGFKKEPKVKIPKGGDAIQGKAIFEKQCATCHAIEGGNDANAAAPSLGGVVGREAGKGTTFPYSNAMKKSNIQWTPKHLFAYIKAPGKYVPGNKMSFAGIKKGKDLANLIAYLESES